jgi:hypothetical protein
MTTSTRDDLMDNLPGEIANRLRHQEVLLRRRTRPGRRPLRRIGRNGRRWMSLQRFDLVEGHPR